ncbi:hypothetical protein [Intestinimonas butyriciproducens]|uniref:Uncharacterized protein n=1 Tax=Intestinimonas butyriciproducens TaxID=1297617 RepID=A0A0S2W1H3_9FIRM|nr:hypothetical protein [Intestinimonas butyriciproducens]ALP93169.1 hypothetical protein IB211_00775c [Intestinimonas butyriciproducens]
MKKIFSGLLAGVLLLSFLAACSPTAEPKICNITVTGADVPMTQFAQEEIMTAGQSHGVEEAWIVSFEGVDESLGEQAYTVTVSGDTISVKGGDDAGLMYGGLEVAEQIMLYGAEGVQETTAAPYVLRRGYMFNAPLDMRAPAYNSAGDAGYNNIETMWDMDFWHEFIDDMARNRYNALLLENINPYPSMVKVQGYEDIALDDVWRSNVPPDDEIMGDCTNIVREADWNDYTVVKEMTIDEKIAFWQEVMAYAKDRGVEFHIKHSNIYTFAEDGQYGITDDPANPVTRDYFYKSAKALLETYPDLVGLFVTPGENMSWSNESASKAANIQWLHDVFGKAVNEVLDTQPDREFVFAINNSASEEIANMMSDINTDVVYSAQYSGTHMYASSAPHMADATFEASVPGATYWIQFRNEDCHDLRWGDPEFMRDYVKGMPGPELVRGFFTGFDGYCFGYEDAVTNPVLKGQLYTDKHWFNYFLIGRMGFEPDLSDTRIADVFAAHYENQPNVDLLLEATTKAGKIIPLVNRAYFQTNSDYTWYVGGCWSHPHTAGYIDIKKWMRGDTTYVDGQTMSIEEYAIAIAKGETPNAQGRMLPTEVADAIKTCAEDVLAKVDQLREAGSNSDNMTFAQHEFWALVSDDEAMAYLGLFYAEKILGAIDIRIFNETEDETYRTSSVTHLEKSADYFDQYAAIISENYPARQLARVGYYDINAIAESVRDDVEIAEDWKPREIRPSYRPPDKEDYLREE